MARVILVALLVIFFGTTSSFGAEEIEIRVGEYGAVGDGVSDDTQAIRAALKAAPEGSTVVFESGKTYLVRRMLRVERRGVKLKGYGATLKFMVSDEEIRGPKGTAHTSIQLLAPYTGAYGLTVTSNMTKRLAGHLNLNGIVIASQHQVVQDNRVEYVQAGIFARLAKDFLIMNNTVSRTFADGIHVTSGSWGGRIVGNTVRETGDDMIAVVNYGAGPPSVGDVVIENNDVSGQYWGRGITVVGGKNVTIRKNKISNTTHGAGILIASDARYNTSDVVNILVEDNIITDVQTTVPFYNPLGTHRKAGHAAIHLYAPGNRSVRDVLIRRNSIHGSWKNGITVWGNSCDVGLQANQLKEVGGKAIQISVKNAPDCSVSCEANTLAGEPITLPECHGSLPSTSGASAR